MSKKPGESRSDTGRQAALKEKLTDPLYKVDAPNDLSVAAELQQTPISGADPYNQVVTEKKQMTDEARRRSLDDMRRLSEDIKSAPQWTRPQKTMASAVDLRLSDLCTTLERALAEIEGIHKGAASPVNPDILARLRSAAYHLESALTSLHAASGG